MCSAFHGLVLLGLRVIYEICITTQGSVCGGGVGELLMGPNCALAKSS